MFPSGFDKKNCFGSAITLLTTKSKPFAKSVRACGLYDWYWIRILYHFAEHAVQPCYIVTMFPGQHNDALSLYTFGYSVLISMVWLFLLFACYRRSDTVSRCHRREAKKLLRAQLCRFVIQKAFKRSHEKTLAEKKSYVCKAVEPY